MQRGLPPTVAALFWDVDPAGLDPERYPRYVIERVLEYGDEDAVRWLRSEYADEAIIDVVCTSRRLSAKTVAFWRRYYHLEEGEGEPCTPKSSRPTPGES